MRFLVDGYNVAKRDPATSALGLADMRDALVARLAVRGADLLGRGDITVVFDGRSGGGTDTRRGPVEVRYARGESADDVIARLAEASRGGVTVVTSDRGLTSRVSGVAARVLGAEVCFEGRTARRTGGRFPARTAGLPPGANKVTEELKKIWLTDEE